MRPKRPAKTRLRASAMILRAPVTGPSASNAGGLLERPLAGTDASAPLSMTDPSWFAIRILKEVADLATAIHAPWFVSGKIEYNLGQAITIADGGCAMRIR